jgi:glycosyltransferase involved in cell wall biosynthesis
MHVVIVNYPFDPEARTPEALLDRYDVLTGWADAATTAGAQVTVVQRFTQDTTVMRRGVHYQFVRDGANNPLRFWQIPQRTHAAAAAARPDVVHLQGQIFPNQTRALRRSLPASARLLVQHHAGDPPSPDEWPGLPRLAMARWGLAAADGFLFTSESLAAPWRDAEIIGPGQPVYPVIEASTSMRPLEPGTKTAQLRGDPAILWVGRLHPVKDPLTVLDGFAHALPLIPDAILTMIYGSDELLRMVRDRVAQADLAGRVDLIGPVAHAELPAFFAAADLFVLGSRREGLGFALIEALACGLAPVVTDIPAFRAVTGGLVGTLWMPGDSRECARALTRVSHGNRPAQRAAARARFEAALSWEVVGREAVAAYADIMRRP